MWEALGVEAFLGLVGISVTGLLVWWSKSRARKKSRSMDDADVRDFGNRERMRKRWNKISGD